MRCKDAASVSKNTAVIAAMLLLWLLLVASAHAEETARPPLQLELVSEPYPELQPRSAVTLVVRLTNRSETALQLEEALELPAGWELMSASAPLALAAGERQVRFISYLVPERAAAGEHQLRYRLFNPERPGLETALQIPVTVLPRPALALHPLEAPEYVISGDSYRVLFQVSNRGNLPLRLAYRLTLPFGTLVTPSQGTLELGSAEERTLEVQVRSETLRRGRRVPLTLHLHDPGNGVEETASASVQVVGSGSDRLAGYHLLPVQLRLSALSQDKVTQGPRGVGWQAELSADGYLDEDLDTRLAFLLRSPERRPVSTFAGAEEYRLALSDKRYALALGDRSYRLSPLTENGFYGRGWQLGLTQDAWQLSAYQVSDRDAAVTASQRGVRLGSLADAPRGGALNYLQRDEQGQDEIASLTGWWRGATGLRGDWELAASDGQEGLAGAWRGQLRYQGAQRYELHWLHAAPDFQGEQQDQMQLTLTGEWPLPERWRLQGRYRYQRQNLALQAGQTAPRSQDWLLGAEYQRSAQSRLGFELQHLARVDGSQEAAFDDRHTALAVSLNQRYRSLQWNLRSTYGQTHKAASGEHFATSSHLLAASWQAAAHHAYGGYLYYNDGAYATSRQPLQKSLGLHANVRLWERVALQVNWQADLQQQPDRHNLQVQLEHQRPGGDRLSLRLRGSNEHNTATAFLATYTRAFGVPVARKRNLASVSGRVFDQQTNQPLARVPVNLGGQVTLTDAAGYYRYEGLPLGEHYLMIEGLHEALERVPADAGQSSLALTQSGHHQIDVPMVRTVSLSGRVLQYGQNALLRPSLGQQDVAASGGRRLPPEVQPVTTAEPRGVANAWVTLSNGRRWYQRRTDRDGYFRLLNVPPGNWLVTLDAAAVPETHAVAQRSQAIDLPPGEQGQIDFHLHPRVREIQIDNNLLIVEVGH